MARKQSSGIDALIDLLLLLAKAPPIISIPAALLGWLVFSQGWLIPDLESPYSELIATMLTMFLQVIAWGLAGAAVISTFYDLYRRFVYKQVSTTESLDDISWKDFEYYCQRWLELEGYSVPNHWDRGPDGGIDIRASKDGKDYIVQCKHWSRNVGVKPVRELFGVAQTEQSDSIFITSSNYTHDARLFAKKSGVSLITGDDLLSVPTHIEPEPQELEINKQPSLCPKCGSDLIERQAKKGANTGKAFFGCKGFPVCRYTQAI